VLDRGYAMVHAGEVLVRDASQVRPRERLHVRLARGSLDVVVERSGSAGPRSAPEGSAEVIDKVQEGIE
jgi:hypothetical protein